MARYQMARKLSKREQNELFIKLAKSIALLRNSQEIAEFLKDLLSEEEVLMLARRLKIAELLMKGATYNQIGSDLKVAAGTIARVQTWLEQFGEGYRTIFKRTSKEEKSKGIEPDTFSQIKKKYPMYYWPELILEEVIRAANQREKKRLSQVVKKLNYKTKLSRELTRLLGK